MEFNIYNGRVFSANFCFECDEDICNAIGVFKLELLRLCESVNCGTIVTLKY